MNTEPYSAAELGRAVERIELDLREIKLDVKAQAQTFVTRGEFEAWRIGIDREVREVKQAVTDGLESIRVDLRGSTPQWWVIAALGVSAITLIVLTISLFH